MAGVVFLSYKILPWISLCLICCVPLRPGTGAATARYKMAVFGCGAPVQHQLAGSGTKYPNGYRHSLAAESGAPGTMVPRPAHAVEVNTEPLPVYPGRAHVQLRHVAAPFIFTLISQ